jgi:predicted DNA-binding protein YlxM (UPF0122 family)
MADPAKLLRISSLLDVYGELLTERQLEFSRAHYEEDLTFAEISEGRGISRQAVHDAVKSAEEALERYESALHLLDRPASAGVGGEGQGAPEMAVDAEEPYVAPTARGKGKRATTPQPPSAPSPDIADVAAELRDVAQGLARAGFAHSPQTLARRLIDLADRLD